MSYSTEIDGRIHWRDRHEHNQTQWQRCYMGHVKPTLRYMTELLHMKCAPDLLALGLFPNAKELAESMATYNAVRRHLPGFAMDDPGVALVAVGDGHVPRTAALFAYRTSWMCHSVDPAMREITWGNRVRRLESWRVRAEDLVGQNGSHGWPLGSEDTVVWNHVPTSAVIVGVHTHARWDAMLRLTASSMLRVAMVVMPCCEPEALPPGGFDASYDDEGVPSPDRTIYVYGPERIAALRALL